MASQNNIIVILQYRVQNRDVPKRLHSVIIAGYQTFCLPSILLRPQYGTHCLMVGWLEFNVPLQHKYVYIRDETSAVES